MTRCLFVNWKDGHPPSQFSVPDDYTLAGRGLEEPPLPPRLTLFDTDTGAELYLDVEQILSAYLITIGPDQRIIETAA